LYQAIPIYSFEPRIRKPHHPVIVVSREYPAAFTWLHICSFLLARALLDPFLNLAFKPGCGGLPNPMAFREAAFLHHLPNGCSPQRDAVSKLFESEVSHVSFSFSVTEIFSPYILKSHKMGETLPNYFHTSYLFHIRSIHAYSLLCSSIPSSSVLSRSVLYSPFRFQKSVPHQIGQKKSAKLTSMGSNFYCWKRYREIEETWWSLHLVNL
jgi:hypothetical protein